MRPSTLALIVLTLGIGATTAIFSVVDAVVLRGLPFDEHDRLVVVGERGSLLGLVISGVGIYGIMAYVVSQRTREIGVRMALGGTRTNVMAMIIGKACQLLTAGLILGGVSAWYLRGAAKTLVYGLPANDPRAFAAAQVSISLAALVPSIIPARRAASIDPIVALRAE